MIRLTWWCSSGKQPHENLKAGTGDFWSWSFHSDPFAIEPPQRSFLLVTSFLHYSHSWMMTCDHSSVCARCLIDRQILLLALGEAHVVRSEESTWEPAPSKTEFYFHTLPSHSGQQRFTRQCLGVFFWGFLLFKHVLFPPLCRRVIQQKNSQPTPTGEQLSVLENNRIRNWEEWMTWLKEADSHFKGFPPRTPQSQQTRWVF